MDEKTLLRLAKTHGTPLVVVDHKALRENYGQFRKYLPRVQVYYAVKANSAPEIVRTFYEAGGELRRRQRRRVPDGSRERQGPAGRAAAGVHLGSDHLRQPDQGHRDARAAGSVQAARHVRQLRGSDQDRAARAARRPRPAAARAQHRLDGRAVEQVRRAAGRGGGSDRVRPEQQARGRGPELPCRQPVHERPELHPGAAPGRERLRRSQIARLRAQAARHRRRIPRALRRHRPGVQDAGESDQSRTGPPVSAADRDSRGARAVPGCVGRDRRSHKSSARQSARASSVTTSTTASITRSAA